MWFMNKIANPVVRMILHSPLHGWMSASLLLLTCRGKKSGREYTLPVQYVQKGSTLYILPGMAEKKTWWRNLRGGARVRLTLAGKSITGWARILQGELEASAIADALRFYLARFPAAAKMHNVRIENGVINPQDLSQATAAAIIVVVEMDQTSAV